jgi:hypothetical protein
VCFNHHHLHPCPLNEPWFSARVQVERTLFEETVKTLNNFYAEAEKIGAHSYLEACVACSTAYLIFLCMETRYEKASARRLVAAL